LNTSNPDYQNGDACMGNSHFKNADGVFRLKAGAKEANRFSVPAISK
jgi:hypothetical protein